MNDDTDCCNEQLDEVIAECIRSEEAGEAGEAVDRETQLAAHPDLADELREFFADRDKLRHLAGGMKGWSRQRTFVPPKVRYIGDYELLEEIARGGMGVVYKARQTSLGRIVAVKMILAGHLAEADDVKRFQSEAEAAASLSHPGIVAVHEVGLHHGRHYFSMDYIEGPNLAERVRDQPLPPRRAAGYVQSIAAAVHYAHGQGVLHRDLKPSNILLDANDQVHVTDFGLARRIEVDSKLTQTGQILGSPSYLAPEQAEGKRALIGPASDIYSLGVILYELLTGRPPFQSDSPVETIRQVLDTEPVSPRALNPAVPRDLETICLKCLQKEPHKRYGTAEHLAADLARFLSGEPIIARPIRVLERSVKWIQRHPMPAAFMASSLVALLAMVGMGIGFFYNAKLDAANSQLRSSNQQLSLTSAELERSVHDVKAERALARGHLYASRMALIQVAEQDGQTARIVQLLRSVIPETEQQEDLRDFEWHYLWRKYKGEEIRLDAHATAVTSLAISPDGNWIATAGRDDHLIVIWDADNYQQYHVLSGHSDGITGLAFSHDSQQLVSASLDLTVKFWVVETGTERRTISGFETAVTAVAYGPDDKQIATGDSTGAIIFWAVNSGEKLTVREDNSQEITDLAFLRQANSLVLGFGNEWSIQQTIEGNTNQSPRNSKTTTNISLDSAGNRIAFGVYLGRDSSSIVLLDVESDSELWKIRAGKLIRRVALSGDGNLVATAWHNQTIEIWNAAENELICTFHTGDTVRSLAFARDGGRIIAGTEEGKLLIWSVPGKEVVTLDNGMTTHWVEFVNNHQVLAPSKEVASVWDVKTGTRRELDLTPTKNIHRWTTSVGNARVVSLRGDELMELVQGQNLVTLKDISQPRQFGNTGQFSIDDSGRLVAGAFASSSVDLWDATTGELLRRFDVPLMATSVALSPNGEFLASGTAWFRGSMPQKERPVKDQLETCFLQVWEVKTGRRVFYRDESFAGGIWDLAFSRDGKHLATAMGVFSDKEMNSGRVQIWDSANWKLKHDLRGHTGSVWSVAFNESGTRLASASGDWTGKGLGQAKVWDVRTGLELLTFAEDKDPIFDIVFSPDSRRLATANRNGSIKIWNGAPLVQSPPYELLPAE